MSFFGVPIFGNSRTSPHSVKWTKGPLKVDAWHLSPWTSVDQVWKPPKSHIPMAKKVRFMKGPHILMVGAKSSKESPPLVDLAASETVLQHLHPYRQQPGHVREVIAAFWGVDPIHPALKWQWFSMRKSHTFQGSTKHVPPITQGMYFCHEFKGPCG